MYEQFRNRMGRKGAYMGEIMRKQSEAVVDSLWMNSVSTRPVQVKVVNSGLPPTYESVDDFDEVLWAHFDANQKFNVTKDEVDYYLTFRPGEMKRHPEIKIGAYVCIPNVDDELEWWLIVYIDSDNELRKANILKCNWVFKWVFQGKIYECLGCQRYAASYNSGIFEMDRTTRVDNMSSAWMPTNSDTKKIVYDQRMIISDEGRDIPLVFSVSKIEPTTPIGITKFRFTQSKYNATTDSKELGLADYYTSSIEPIPNNPTSNIGTIAITYNGTNPTVKVGGSEKVFTVQLPKDNHFDIKWSLSDGVNTYGDSYDNYKETFGDYTIVTEDRVMRLKVARNYELIGTILTIKALCADGSSGEIEVEVVG